MSHSRYTVAPAGHSLSRFAPHAVLTMGGVGAIVGGTAAAARNIRRVKEAEISREEAIANTMKEAAGAGFATATASAVVQAVGATGVLSLLGVLAVATGAKYLWDAAMTPAKARVEPRAAQPAEALEHPKG